MSTSPLPTALQVVQANDLAVTQQQVAQLNSSLQSNYLNFTFPSWLGNWTSGRQTDIHTAPQPPNGYVVGFFNDPTTGPGSLGPYGNLTIQWPYPAVGTMPVCSMPPIPPQAPPNTQSPAPGNQYVMDVPAGDNTPVGMERTDPSTGIVWIREDTKTPWGVEHEYLNEQYLTTQQIASIKAGE